MIAIITIIGIVITNLIIFIVITLTKIRVNIIIVNCFLTITFLLHSRLPHTVWVNIAYSRSQTLWSYAVLINWSFSSPYQQTKNDFNLTLEWMKHLCNLPVHTQKNYEFSPSVTRFHKKHKTISLKCERVWLQHLPQSCSTYHAVQFLLLRNVWMFPCGLWSVFYIWGKSLNQGFETLFNTQLLCLKFLILIRNIMFNVRFF